MIRLKTLREMKGVSQKEIAAYINKTPQAYSLYETGKRDPDIHTLKKLAEYFSVSLDYLLEYSPSEDITDTPCFPNQKRLIKKISSTDPETAAELEQYLNYLESKKNQLSTADHEKK